MKLEFEMELDIHKDKKLICIWLPKSEADYEPSSFVRAVFSEYKRLGYSVAILKSGTEDLTELTTALLKHNRFLMAKRELSTLS